MIRSSSSVSRLLSFTLVIFVLCLPGFGATSSRKKPHATSRSSVRKGRARAVRRIPDSVKKAAPRKAALLRKAVARTPSASMLLSGVVRGGPWTEPTYADSTSGDETEGEDLEIRRAAVEALGPYNGSIVVTDPDTGRILTIVNQKLALGPGYQPCSTIKLSVALASLS